MNTTHTHELGLEDKVALARDVEAAVAAAVNPLMDRFKGLDVCPCCVARGVIGGMVPLLAEHATFVAVDPTELGRMLQMIADQIVLRHQMNEKLGTARA